MCGICGIRRFGDTPISRDMIDLLILNNQNRGLDATGIALQQQSGAVVILKNDVTALEFIASDEYDEFMKQNLQEDTLIALGHTRKATKGTPRVISNNHPMYTGTTALVHNGQIHNDDWAFGEFKVERKTETDSDILRAILDKEGFTRKAINMMSRLTGNAAFAAISPKYPGKLLLARSGNPIEIAGTKDFLVFSSERGPLYKAMRPYRQVYGVQMREMTPINYCMVGMNDNSAWLWSDKPKDHNASWDADWLEWHQELRIANNYSPVTYACHAQYFGNRVKFYDDRPVDVVECPGCHHYMSVSSAMLRDLKKYECGKCGTPLA